MAVRQGCLSRGNSAVNRQWVLFVGEGGRMGEVSGRDMVSEAFHIFGLVSTKVPFMCFWSLVPKTCEG